MPNLLEKLGRYDITRADRAAAGIRITAACTTRGWSGRLRIMAKSY